NRDAQPRLSVCESNAVIGFLKHALSPVDKAREHVIEFGAESQVLIVVKLHTKSTLPSGPCAVFLCHLVRRNIHFDIDVMDYCGERSIQSHFSIKREYWCCRKTFAQIDKVDRVTAFVRFKFRIRF